MNNSHFKARIRTIAEYPDSVLAGTILIDYFAGNSSDGLKADTMAIGFQAKGRAADLIRERYADSYLLLEGALMVEPPNQKNPNHLVVLRVFNAIAMESLEVDEMAEAA
jgi:hypothetical protein